MTIAPTLSTGRSAPGLVRGAGAAILLVAALAVYWPSLRAPFIFDDVPGVEHNATIRQLWPPWKPLVPPNDGSGVSGRPLVNLTLAFNYAGGGLDVLGYHLTNVFFHALTAFVLWRWLRRTMRLPRAGRAGEADVLSWCVVALWTVHPLLTESVSCVVQRNEILGSLFYLLTLYGFTRAVEFEPETRLNQADCASKSGRYWLVLSFISCLLGVATKEIIATAPLVVFLYDRTFATGSFKEAWRLRRRYYTALAATWLPLVWLVWHGRQRGGTVGFGLDVSPWEYLLTQCQALVLYLKLVFWPHPLVLDYGWPTVRSLGEVWGQAGIVLALLAATVVALVRRPAIGFAGASFFIFLAPSSSFIPLASQTIAEHRMYLPLAAVLTLVVLGVQAVGARAAVAVTLAALLPLGWATMVRNRDYRTELGIWTDTVAKRPDNARAQGNLGRAYLLLGRWEEAIAACRKELELAPGYNGDASANIGRALTELGRPAEALPYFERGLQMKPDNFDLHNNYGIALAALGRWSAAISQYGKAIQLQPDDGELHNNLANALAKSGRLDEALMHYEAALRLRPDLTAAETNWARALAEAGRVSEALPHFEHLAKVRSDAATQFDLALALVAAGRTEEACGHFETALRLKPGDAAVHSAYGNALARLGRLGDATAQYESALQLQPSLAEAHHNLATALMGLGRAEQALPHFEATARLLPGSAEAQYEWALALGELRRWREAIEADERALALQPDLTGAKEHLAWLREQR
ncbi:MAG TPA: tetratricopeptide repeat protein [Lacunisphaera sp.]|nr:tetratricopeptide repeat protein [Lacunisphaera sp.]